MKRLLCILSLFLLLFSFTSAQAWLGPVIAGATTSSTSAYCTGSELVCLTFESTPTWDAYNGSWDCDGYDADGDYCDEDTTVPDVSMGTKSLGIRGSSTYYVSKNFSTADQGEFYFEGWIRWADAVSNTSLTARTSTGTEVLLISIDTDGSIKVLTKDGATVLDSNYVTTGGNWYHIGIYIKNETAADNNDGIIRIWANTSITAGFESSDLKNSSTTVDTGVALADLVRFRGTSGEIVRYDNIKIVSGSPSWGF